VKPSLLDKPLDWLGQEVAVPVFGAPSSPEGSVSSIQTNGEVSKRGQGQR
jgi:hypothetical protein